MNNFEKRGHTFTKTLAETVASGEAIVLDDRAGIACEDGVSTDVIEVLVEGCVRYAKAAVTVHPGTKLYYDESEDKVTDDPDTATNKPIGWGAEEAATGATDVLLKLGAW